MIEITDPEVIKTSGKRFHPIVEPSDNPADEVQGRVFRITEAELKAADEYEVADYKRVAGPASFRKQGLGLRSRVKAF